MKVRVINNVKDKDLVLEGTEDILLDIPKEDKFFILALASDLNVNVLGDSISLDVFKNYKGRYNMPNNKALKCLIIAMAYYYYNLPKGFKRIANSNDIVNEEGTVLKFNRKPMNYYINNKGYVQVPLYRLDVNKRITKTIHRIVAETFIPNPENKPQVNHIDCDKANNKKSNLEWNTQVENMSHARENGLRNTPALKAVGKGEANSQAKLNKNIVRTIRDVYSKEDNKIKTYLAELFDIDIPLVEEVLVFKNIKKVPVKYIMSKRRNSRSLTYFDYEKRFCNNEESYIRANYLKFKNKLVKNLSKKHNISYNTILDIVKRRSWNYNDC